MIYVLCNILYMDSLAFNLLQPGVTIQYVAVAVEQHCMMYVFCIILYKDSLPFN